jgi:hypothetical protein
MPSAVCDAVCADAANPARAPLATTKDIAKPMIFRIIWALPRSTFIFRWSQIDRQAAASNIRVYPRLRLCAVVPAAFKYGGSPHTGHKQTHVETMKIYRPSR